MSGPDGIEVEGRIVEALPKGLFRVELANGHRFLGHVTRQERGLAGTLAAGDRVRVRMSHYDLSRGCIMRKES